MSKQKLSIILGLVCLLLTFFIIVQIKSIEKTNSSITQNSSNNKLRDQVLQYKEKYDNAVKQLEQKESELEKQRNSAINNNEGLENTKIELELAKKISGFTDVTGQGVIITLDDNKEIKQQGFRNYFKC